MSNRVLRDWTNSFKVDELSVHSERFFVRLIMKVDDFGRFYADERLLRSNLFPLKSDIREADISRWIAECEKAGLIVVYHVAQKRYVQINDFNQRLRQKKEKFPSPKQDGQSSDNCKSIDGLKQKQKQKQETENDVVVKTPPPVVFGSDSITSIDNLAKEALQDQVNFVEHIYRQFRIDPQSLPNALEAFNRHLKSIGDLMKRKKDYRIHFQNWVRKQSFGNSPSKPKMRQI